MKMNQEMCVLYEAESKRGASVPRGLVEIVEEGFVTDGRHVFLRRCYMPETNAERAGFGGDEVGYECFINHVHMDEHAAQQDIVAVGIAYAEMLRTAWCKQSIPGTIRIIVSAEYDDCTVRFHLVRPNETWIEEGFENKAGNPLMTLDVTSGENEGRGQLSWSKGA